MCVYILSICNSSYLHKQNMDFTSTSKKRDAKVEADLGLLQHARCSPRSASAMGCYTFILSLVSFCLFSVSLYRYYRPMK